MPPKPVALCPHPICRHCSSSTQAARLADPTAGGRLHRDSSTGPCRAPRLTRSSPAPLRQPGRGALRPSESRPLVVTRRSRLPLPHAWPHAHAPPVMRRTCRPRRSGPGPVIMMPGPLPLHAGQHPRTLEAARVSCGRHPAAGWSVRTLPTPRRSLLVSLLTRRSPSLPVGGDGESVSSVLHWQATALAQLVGPVTTLR
jgi:hypothetical protein